MRCVDVAALFAAAILRRNPDSVVIPFDTRAYGVRVDPGDTILSLSERLARYGGGGTDCSIPLREANTKHRKRAFAGCVLVSDNESWVHRNRAFAYGRHGATGVMDEWQTFVANQKRLGVSSPKLVCIDIQPYGSTQAPERADILNIGGFSDAVFSVVAAFLAEDTGGHQGIGRCNALLLGQLHHPPGEIVHDWAHAVVIEVDDEQRGACAG